MNVLTPPIVSVAPSVIISKPEASIDAPSFLQTKLTIGAVDDHYEREADAMADQVVRSPLSGAAFQGASSSATKGESIQRKCAACEEEKVQRKPIPGIQRKAQSETAQASPQVSQAIADNRGGGQPLDHATRGFMEGSFGRDFSSVKVHTGPQAAELNQSLSAKAFTVGNDIFFNQGQYNPQSQSGKHLLAHELTHTVQQGSAGMKVQRQPATFGPNPGCDAVQTAALHAAITTAKSWTTGAVSRVNANRNDPLILPALQRHFGPTHGTMANLTVIMGRVKAVGDLLSKFQFRCLPAIDPQCKVGSCGYSYPGSSKPGICPNTITTSGNYLNGCVLHESFHATYSNFTADNYSGWNGASQSTPGYPGKGTVPLINADSYTSLALDLK